MPRYVRTEEGDTRVPGPDAADPDTGIGLSLAVGAVATFGIHIMGTGLNYVLQVLLVRWMGPADFGVLSFALAAAGMAAVVGTAGWPAVVVRFAGAYADDHGRLRGLVQTGAVAVAAGTGAVALAVVLGFTLVPVLAQGPYRDATLVAAAIAPLLGLSMFVTEVLRSRARWATAFGVPRLARPVVVLGSAAGAVAAGIALDALAAVLLYIAGHAVVLGVQGVAASRSSPWRRAPPEPVRETRSWMHVAAAMFFVAGFATIIDQSDVLLVGAMLGETEAGIYHVIARTAHLVQFAPVAALAVVGPTLSRWFHQRPQDDVQRLVTQTVRWTFAATAAIAAVLLLASDLVLGLFGPLYQAARPEMAVLVAARVGMAALGPAAFMMYLGGLHKRLAVTLGIGAGANLGLNLALIPVWGIMGAVMATAVVLILVASINASAANNSTGVRTIVAWARP